MIESHRKHTREKKNMIINKNNNQQRKYVPLYTLKRLASWLFFFCLVSLFLFCFLLLCYCLPAKRISEIQEGDGWAKERERKNQWQTPSSRSSPKIALRLESRPTARDNCVKKCDVGVKLNLLFFWFEPTVFYVCVCVCENVS